MVSVISIRKEMCINKQWDIKTLILCPEERGYDADTVTSIEVLKYLQDPYHQTEKKTGLEENMSPTNRAENNSEIPSTVNQENCKKSGRKKRA
jgi:hypothetical protein